MTQLGGGGEGEGNSLWPCLELISVQIFSLFYCVQICFFFLIYASILLISGLDQDWKL